MRRTLLGLVGWLFLQASSAAATVSEVYLFESGLPPYEPTGAGLSIWGASESMSGNWIGHRFEVTTPRRLDSAGAFFSALNPGSSIELFIAIVALEGPTDLPEPRDLSGPGLLGVQVITRAGDEAEQVAFFDLDLAVGWHMLVIGHGALGAEDFQGFGAFVSTGVPVGWADGDLDQPVISMRTDGSFHFEQEGVARMFATPEPHAVALGAAALAALATLRRRR